MINKNILEQESKLLYAEIANLLGEDSWELHFCEEYLSSIIDSYYNYDANGCKECLRNLNALFSSLKKKFGEVKFNDLRSKITNICNLMDSMNEYTGKKWCSEKK